MTMKRLFSKAGLWGASPLILCLCLAPVGTATFAQESLAFNVKLQEESDGADRIQIAGQLPTLIQQVAATSCAISSGVDADDVLTARQAARDTFDTYLFALRYGDVGLDIVAPEERRLTLAALDRVEAEWRLLQAAVDADLTGEDAETQAQIIDAYAGRLLDMTNVFAAGIAGQYAHPHEISATDLLMLMIAGRQRTLSQKMAKQACHLWTGEQTQVAKDDLRKTMIVFESSLNALRFGLPKAGLEEAPTEAIREELDRLLARWEVIKVRQQNLLEGEMLSTAQKTEVFQDLTLELDDLDALLQGYKEHAERSHATRTTRRDTVTPAKPSLQLRLRPVP